MSTEIKNTLYRFVTMRAPELLEHPRIVKSFVTFSGDSSFVTAVQNAPSGSSRRQALFEASNAFVSSAFQNTNELRNTIGIEFFDFSIWLTKNRSNFSLDEIQRKRNDLSPTVRELFNANSVQVWDNLFYQIITVKSSYVRDAIISVLVADFFLTRCKVTEEDIEVVRNFANARVILPSELFGVEDNSLKVAEKKPDLTKLPINNKNLQQANELLLLDDNTKSYNAIRQSLLKIEKLYDIDYKKRIKLYDTDYSKQVSQAYANATKVTKTYKDPVTLKEKKYNIIEDLNLPDYQFEPKNQLEFCKEVSGDNDIHNNFIKFCVEKLKYSTFNEVYNYIDEALKRMADEQFSRLSPIKKIANVDGVTINTDNSGSYARTASGFSIITSYSNLNQYLLLTFNGMEPGTDIISGEYTLTFGDSTAISGEYVNESNSMEWLNGKLVLRIFNYSGHFFDASQEGTFTLNGNFTSSTGRNLNIDGKGNIITLSNFDGLTSIAEANQNIYNDFSDPVFMARGNGNYVYEDLLVGSSGIGNSNDLESGTNNNTNQVSSSTITSSQNVIDYIPSGYGIKRLGIADYRKVEQEVCCYVPGEVSHIENIMAREYKEKSTRRLRRQEDTITSTKEKETEKLTDSTSTERFEMNQEIGSVIAEQNSSNFHTGVSAEAYGVRMEASADFAHNTSQETSNNQAVTDAKEITQRALDRVVQKVKEERVTKIIEEFEENNKHGYDNRKGDKHISGVYRWVDKIYRNRIINYGKRLMYEFMIPEPATFHNLAIERRVESNEVTILEKPIDPRTAESSIRLGIDDNFDIRYMHWAKAFNVEVTPPPVATKTIGKSLSGTFTTDVGTHEAFSIKEDLVIEEGYFANSAIVAVNGTHDGLTSSQGVFCSIGDKEVTFPLSAVPFSRKSVSTPFTFPFSNFVPFAITFANMFNGAVSITLNLSRSSDLLMRWRIETFNAIIAAYEEKLQKYNDETAELKSVQSQKAKVNPLFYRQIENTVLRKNCIEYLVSHAVLGGTTLVSGNSFDTTQVMYDHINLETYAAKVKFFEQAFEWNLMSYNFYPFYWAQRSKWQDLYNVEEQDDPIFRAFLQSGMARVIVTVRPGFEEAVNWYIGTGQVWNGGQVPTLNDPLFISIVNELQQAESVVEETWESRVPTSLTVIQAGSIGLKVEGLPCDEDCKDYSGFDSDNNPINTNPIVQNLDQDGNPVNLGNVVEDLETVTESIEEIKVDIEHIKTTLDGMNP